MNPLLIRRRGMMKAQGGVLPYDSRIEYLESTGTQYIDLGFSPSHNIIINANIYRPNNNCVFDCGAEIGWTDNIVRFVTIKNGNVAWRCTKSVNTNPSITAGTNCVGNLSFSLRINHAEITNNTTSHSYSKNMNGDTPISPNFNFLLFASNINGVVSLGPDSNGVKLYNFDVQDTNIDMQLISVRVGSVGYLYDNVSGQLFGNSGTGDFILGPDIQ